MGRWNSMVVGLVGIVVASGCVRSATRITEMPRVDLNLAEGNRGYLVGTPPEPGSQKTTRQMIGTDIEIPSFYKPKKGAGGAATLEGTAPPGVGLNAQPVTDQAPAGPHDTYVVQKGDSLWSIAAKPEIYGKAARWSRIFEANRDILKSPDRLKAGMTLKIPRGQDAGSGGSTTYDDDGGITYKK